MSGQFIHIRHFIEKISTNKNDSPKEKRNKITLVLLALFCCLTGIASVTRAIYTMRDLPEILSPLVFVITVGISLVLYFFSKRLSIILYPFLVMILIIPVVFQISIGGFAGQGSVPIVLWAFLASFGAMMFQNIQKADRWFSVYLLLVILCLIFDEYFTQFAELPISFESTSISHGDLMTSNGLTILVLSVVIYLALRYFVNAFQKEHSRAENLVVDLQQNNTNLATTLKELQGTQAELVQSEKMAALGKLAAGIAHEINNPIGALKSTSATSARCVEKLETLSAADEQFAEIAQNKQYQNYIHILKENNRIFEEVSKRVGDSVHNFIQFARLDKAGLDRVDIHLGLDHTLQIILQEIKAKTVVKKQYGDIPLLACYPGELNQVFMHLLKNAAQAIEDEGEIHIQTFQQNDNIFVKIRDTGRGISADKLAQLFDPGFSKNGVRMKAGLGLFTSYNIMQKHRGQIKAESTPGSGSTFTLILPTDLEQHPSGNG